MAGANIRVEVGVSDALNSVSEVGNVLRDPKPMLREVNEHLIRAHRQRFQDQRAPDGTPWQALSPSYQRRKHRNKNRILTFRGRLQGSLRGQVNDEGLIFGTNVKYGAIHHFGGDIKQKARTSSVFFKRRRDGSVGNRFVKKSRSDFAQDVNVGARTIRIPARPWLGTSTEDDETIQRIALRYLEESFS